jgi:hypothetical protein
MGEGTLCTSQRGPGFGAVGYPVEPTSVQAPVGLPSVEVVRSDWWLPGCVAAAGVVRSLVET